jgi:pullulanase-type alpha-1,6-glucosidase
MPHLIGFISILLFTLSSGFPLAFDKISESNAPQSKFKTALEARIDGASAHWVEPNVILWNYPESAVTFKLHYSAGGDLQLNDDVVVGGNFIELIKTGVLAWHDTHDKYRHIKDWPRLEVKSNTVQIRDALKSQLLVAAYDADGKLLQLTKLQIPGVLDALYAYDGHLGPAYTEDEISVSVWAPTAQRVRLRIYDADKNPVALINPVEHSVRNGGAKGADLEPNTDVVDRSAVESAINKNVSGTAIRDGGLLSNGVWTFKGSQDWDRMYYRFVVQVYHYEDNRIHEYEVTDPYSVSLSMNSDYSQFVNLGDADLKPAGWDDMRKELPRGVDVSVYEAHLRDFSVWDFSVPEAHRGTYMAFAYNGENGREISDGMAHLKRLSAAGLTHLHLLPLNDISTINENRDERVELDDPYSKICETIQHERFQQGCEEYGDRLIRDVFEELAEEDPITLAIQEPYNRLGNYMEAGRSDGLATYDGFNWGYDPYHFNVPEGSYSTDPEGTQRILELRSMVQSLYEIDLLTVVDVVYNHTTTAGLTEHSVLDRMVPGYYMRRDPVSGDVETSTCCENTAAEYVMMEKLIIDSTLLWAKEYKIDSFRFDLMGHHPVYVMENVQKALVGLTLEKDGVDGAGVYVYGEGWNFGEVANDRIFVNATQFNLAGTGIGNFNDRNRDAIRGGMFSDWVRNQGFTSGQFVFPNEDAGDDRDAQRDRLFDYGDRIRVGLAGNLKTYRYTNRVGRHVLGGEEGIGYTLVPQENVNYVDKHDNETLWDNTQPKLPMDMKTWDRVRIHVLSQAIINYSQGIPFHQMGSDILRSKSMDRNSYDSGDWFNKVDFTLETHNWGRGMPPAWDNERRWEDIRPHLLNPNISVTTEHIEWAHHVFMDQLRVRYSTPLLRLAGADEVHERIMFHNVGPDQVPGVIAMSVSDGICAGENLDPNYDGIFVLINARNEAFNYAVDLTGYEVHPILKNGTDDALKNIEVGAQGVMIPPHSALVLVLPQRGAVQGVFQCNTAL